MFFACSANAVTSEKSCNWAAYYQECKVQEPPVLSSSIFLLLINEIINSPVMVKPCMTVIQKVIQRVSPRQIPIITADQPIYALLIQIN